MSAWIAEYAEQNESFTILRGEWGMENEEWGMENEEMRMRNGE